MRKPARGPTLLTVLALVAGLAAGCSSGGDDGGGGTDNNPAGPTRCVGFTSTTPTSGQVAGRQGGGTTCDVLALEIVVAGVNDVFAAEFMVNFDPTVLVYTGVSDAGSLLRSGNVQTAVQGSASGGTLTAGISRLDDTAPGVDFPAGGALLMTVFFRKATNNAVAGSNVTFSGPQLLDGQAPPQPIPGVTWLDGTASIQ